MRPPGTRSGLTLIEVLVIIFVVAILMGFLSPAGGSGNAARKAQTRNDLTQLAFAINAFHTDYGFYPIDRSISRKTDAVYGYPGWSHHNSELVNVLLADGTDAGPNFRNAINTHQTVYLDVPLIRDPANPRSGLGTGKETNSYGVTTPGEWYDPYGAPYIVIIDANGDGVCDLGQLFYSDIPSPHFGAAGISFGKDKKVGTNGDREFRGSDDIISWNE
jgi:type II secretory pathway pseudopilin PulG